jgi:hypothetical protein
MPLTDIQDLEEFWDVVKVDRVQVCPEEADGPEAVIDRALSKLDRDLPGILKKEYTGRTFQVPEHLIAILMIFARKLLNNLYLEQQQQDVSVLIQLFLEVPSLPPIDMKDFIRSLPRDLLNRILVRLEERPRKTGLQALLSIETMWRDRSLHQDYEVHKDGEGKLIVTFYPIEHPGPLSFRLRELFCT